MISPHLNLKSNTPIYIQLYAFIKKEIQFGFMKENSKLPSKRNLAQHLGISVNTITKSYELLIDEGYIYSQERIGYFVSSIDNLAQLSIDKKEINTNSNKTSNKFHGIKCNFKINNIDNDYFPLSIWRKITSNIINNHSEELLHQADNRGLFRLRYDISRYLKQSRGVKVNPNNIIIGSGMEYLLQILLYLLPSDSSFAMENPGYKDILKLFTLNSINCDAISLDRNGIKINDLKKSMANIVLVTPSHQFPTGIIMPINRRLQLLNWSNTSSNNFIIEDDHDSEFKYYGKPIPALKSLDTRDKVIYIGNFSKSISPFLRVSYMILPEKLIKNYEKKVPFLTCPVSNLTQLTLAKFMEEGYFERHINRMRKIYNKKRIYLSNILKNYENIKVIDSKAGLHFILKIKTNKSEKELLKTAAQNNVLIESLSSYYYSKQDKDEYPKIVLGYGNFKKTMKDSLKNILNSWNTISYL